MTSTPEANDAPADSEQAVVSGLRAWINGLWIKPKTIVDILEREPGLTGREIRQRLRTKGIRKTVGGFYCLMARLEDMGIVSAERRPFVIHGVHVTHRCYWKSR